MTLVLCALLPLEKLMSIIPVHCPVASIEIIPLNISWTYKGLETTLSWFVKECLISKNRSTLLGCLMKAKLEGLYTCSVQCYCSSKYRFCEYAAFTFLKSSFNRFYTCLANGRNNISLSLFCFCCNPMG